MRTGWTRTSFRRWLTNRRERITIWTSPPWSARALAEIELYDLYWSERILAEVTRNLILDRRATEEQASDLTNAMRSSPSSSAKQPLSPDRR